MQAFLQNLDPLRSARGRDEPGQPAASFDPLARQPLAPRQNGTDEFLEARQATEIVFDGLPGGPRDGAGLGLAICREIVLALDGRIGAVAASNGQGSEFFFVLPALT